MVAFVVKNFGGEIPREDPRLLPDNMAVEAFNCDLQAGPLDGLPQPQSIIALSADFPIRKAYRMPGPTASDPSVWMPLPSEFSSVVRSPLANDTLHAYYWTNPPGVAYAGPWWNTYARVQAGGTYVPSANQHYNLGFTSPDPAHKLTVTVTGGTYPGWTIWGADIVDRGRTASPGDWLEPGIVTDPAIPASGTPAPEQPIFAVHVKSTSTTNQAILDGGVGGTDGGFLLTGTTGGPTPLQVWGTIIGGSLAAISIVDPGVYTTNPSNSGYDTVSGGGLSGAIIRYDLGVWDLDTPTISTYTVLPPGDPVPMSSIIYFTEGVTAHLVYNWNDAPPLVERSYCYTYIDQYGYESSPNAPSDVVAGPVDASWTITGLPTAAPASPAGKHYPTVTALRLYRTITSASGQAQFYQVVDLPFPTSGTYVDTIADISIVSNETLPSVSWAPPVDNLDGLLSMPGGMLVGFTGNTVHFCEPDRPLVWPAGYDQSLIYPIVALALWQQSLVVLTSGFPSTGTGNSPAQFSFAQIQAPEPCIARGSVVTDLAGVYYASQNGLIALNYFGAQNQTLSNMTRVLWLTEYQAAHIVACRHRAQYLAINGTGQGFVIDYTEQRMGVVHVTPFLDVVSVWNDVYTGDAYMMAGGTVYLWDSTTTPSLIYRWRSREFYMQAPVSLGACQISLDPAVAQPAPADVVASPPAHAPHLDDLPAGVNALFRMFVGPSQELVHEQQLLQPRCIFRLPSGRKAFNWQFEILARVPVHSVELASTMRELKGV